MNNSFRYSDPHSIMNANMSQRDKKLNLEILHSILYDELNEILHTSNYDQTKNDLDFVSHAIQEQNVELREIKEEIHQLNNQLEEVINKISLKDKEINNYKKLEIIDDSNFKFISVVLSLIFFLSFIFSFIFFSFFLFFLLFVYYIYNFSKKKNEKLFILHKEKMEFIVIKDSIELKISTQNRVQNKRSTDHDILFKREDELKKKFDRIHILNQHIKYCLLYLKKINEVI